MINWYMEKIKEYEQLLTSAADNGDNNRVAYLGGVKSSDIKAQWKVTNRKKLKA